MTRLVASLAGVLAALLAGAATVRAVDDPFAPVAAVFLHERCTNCHTGTEQPFWGARPHGGGVSGGLRAGKGRPGLRCTGCHGPTNIDWPGAPPGAEDWHLAPPAAGWRNDDAQALCARLKDPGNTGDRGLAALATHLERDALVAWTWSPGPGREPPPGTLASLVEAFRTWAAEGAPCPGDGS